MKDRAAVVVLIIVAIGLGVGLIVVNQHSETQHRGDLDRIVVLSNDMVQAKASEMELQSVNQALETNLVGTRADYSNKLVLSEANLHTLEANLDKAQAEAKQQSATDAASIAERDKKIADLTAQNQNLDAEDAELRASITNLDQQIDGAKKALTQARGDRTLLLSELKQLQARKDNLEAMFNNLTVLRERVRELKHELAVSRQLDWIRRGAYFQMHEKGGERMLAAHEQVEYPTNVALNVTVKQNGGATITPLPSNNGVNK